MSKIKVLFMQSQTYFGADSQIHSALMENFDRSRVEVHVACNCGPVGDLSASARALRQIPDLHFRPTNFGPSINERSKSAVLREATIGGLPALGSLAGLALYARQHDIDIIHCTEKPRDAFYGFLLSRMVGAKCLIHLHVKAETWISPLVRWSMKYADAIVGVSQFVAESTVAMGYRRERTYCVLNGIEPDSWPSRADGGAVRAQFGIDRNSIILSIISRLFYWKGHTLLLKALAQVKERVPNVKLLIVGEDDPRGHPGGGSYLEELKTKAAKLGLEEEVIFTGFRKDIPEILAASDMFVMPSFEEPFGMVYLEAMTMSRPVVALDNGGAREVVEDGKSGLLSLPEDVDSLAENIVRLAQSPELREEMGAYGRKRVYDCFTTQRMTGDMEKVYRTVLGDGAEKGSWFV